jgi:hypothetical protein
MIAEGDWVVTRALMSVTPPERQGHADYGIALYRVLDGAIAEEWVLWSGYYVYSQIRGW